MPQYFSPGVYVEDVPPVARPIAGVGTSTPGFIGVVPDVVRLPSRPLAGETTTAPFRWVQYGPLAAAQKPVLVTSWNAYVKLFGDFIGSNVQPTKKIVVEGTGAAAVTYVTGTAPPGQQVSATVTGGAAATATTNADGVYKIAVAATTTENTVTVTTTVASTGAALTDSQQRLAHAVYGFFNNGGSSCYVVRIAAATDLAAALAQLAAVPDVTIVAAPGLVSAADYKALTDHCELLKDRVAILDSTETVAAISELQAVMTSTSGTGRPQNSSYGAFYFPWLRVADPASALTGGSGFAHVPPSGHLAGIYARSDASRGVFKAPANEALQGVVDLKYALSKPDQDNLNGIGVNVIRPLIGAFRVWGGRTIGGDANGEFRYISTRRYLNFLRESIDQGTQWVVFEPNTPSLWQRITRTLDDFLTNQWRDGALFGETPKKAFFVRCNADTNPPELRESGQVVTEIGVAIVKPAEFVIFRIQQTTGG
jgi:phage tail sheath protein FI